LNKNNKLYGFLYIIVAIYEESASLLKRLANVESLNGNLSVYESVMCMVNNLWRWGESTSKRRV